MHINKSIRINASPEEVHKVISDFHSWPKWSPWLISEPEAKVTIREDGQYYEWEGKRVGSGNMTILEQNSNSVKYDLTFLKPWKSKAKVGFKINSHEDHSHVSWTMDSSLPFFMFFMKKTMETYVGMDYDRGLKMLKEYIEDGKIKSQMEFRGESKFPGYKYIGIKSETNQAGLGEKMSADIEKLTDIVQEQEENIAGEVFSIYHKFDAVKDKVIYTSGIPVKEFPADLPSGVITGEIPATKVHTLRHIGSYEHLGNAWTTMMMMERNKELKFVKGIHPFESYVNMPGEVPDEELITDIHFAVK